MDSRVLKVLGFYHKQNIGDEAYKLVFPKLFPKYKLEFLDNGDADILGGGDVLTKHYLSQIKKPIHAISVSASEDIREYKHLIKYAIVRDYHSLNILKEQKIPASYVPDITFLLNPASISLDDYFTDRHKYKKVISVFLNSYLLERMNNYRQDHLTIEKMLTDLARVADDTNASFLFLSCCTSMPYDDRVINAYLQSKLKFWQKTNVVYHPLSPQEILNIINSSDAIISTRLHSSVFATLCQKPFLDILHNHKNPAFLETINYNKSITLDEFNYKDCKRILDDILENKPSLPDLNIMRNQIFKEVAKNVHIPQ